MEPWLIGVGCILLSGYLLVRNVRLLRDEVLLRKYLQESPKAKLWVGQLGLERTLTLTKRLFIPLGIAVSAVLFSSGVRLLYYVVV